MPSTAPTPLPLYTVWCCCKPSFSHSSDFFLPFQYRTAAALIFPCMPDLSVKTFTSGSSCSRFLITSHLSFAMLVVFLGVQLVAYHIALMVSISFGWIWYLCMRLCCKGTLPIVVV
jgi:hypothetical protein